MNQLFSFDSSRLHIEGIDYRRCLSHIREPDKEFIRRILAVMASPESQPCGSYRLP